MFWNDPPEDTPIERPSSVNGRRLDMFRVIVKAGKDLKIYHASNNDDIISITNEYQNGIFDIYEKIDTIPEDKSYPYTLKHLMTITR